MYIACRVFYRRPAFLIPNINRAIADPIQGTMDEMFFKVYFDRVNRYHKYRLHFSRMPCRLYL
jgi:hypothetical protein